MTIFTGAFATIFGVYYLRNRENMALIERGFNPREGRKVSRSFLTLRYGLLLAGAGLGLLLAFFIDQNITNKVIIDGNAYEREYPQIYLSLVALFGGLGLIVSNRLEKKEWERYNRVEDEAAAIRKPQPYDQVIS